MADESSRVKTRRVFRTRDSRAYARSHRARRRATLRHGAEPTFRSKRRRTPNPAAPPPNRLRRVIRTQADGRRPNPTLCRAASRAHLGRPRMGCSALEHVGESVGFSPQVRPPAFDDIEPTMRLFFEQARAADDSRLRETAFGFGAWLHRFTDLREELRAPKPAHRLNPRDRARVAGVELFATRDNAGPRVRLQGRPRQLGHRAVRGDLRRPVDANVAHR